MFVEARKYLEKLIRIRKKMIAKKLVGSDTPHIKASMNFIETQLSAYKYASDEKMRGFLERHHDEIRKLIPGENYPGFKKLMNEFINLQNQ